MRDWNRRGKWNEAILCIEDIWGADSAKCLRDRFGSLRELRRHLDSMNLENNEMQRGLMAVFRLAALIWNESAVTGERISCPADIARVLRGEFIAVDREEFKVLLIDEGGCHIHTETVAIGTQHSLVVSSRAIFKSALQYGVSKIAVAHNHPSGILEPSQEDVATTHEIVYAGWVLDIDVVDHLIVGRRGIQSDYEFVSLRELGCFPESDIQASSLTIRNLGP